MLVAGALGGVDRVGVAPMHDGHLRQHAPERRVPLDRVVAPGLPGVDQHRLGATDELAWEKAERTLGDIHALQAEGASVSRGRLRRSGSQPENAGSQRLLAAAEAGERHDRALWTATSAATGGGGNSTALVGSPETVAAALLDYYDLGVRIFSARGYNLYDDAVDFGRHVIPLVRQEVARREAAPPRRRLHHEAVA